MIHSFDKEAFMQAPVKIEIQQEVREIPTQDNRAFLLQPMERSLVLSIGDQDYDVRELVWRLLSAERQLWSMEYKIQQLEAALKQTRF